MTELEKYKSLLVIVVGFGLLSLLFDIRLLWLIGLGVGTVSLIIPSIGDLVLLIWSKIALVLGYVNTRILLSLVFFVFLTPIALIRKLTGGGKIKKDEKNQSWYTVRDHTYTKADLENPW